MPLLLAGWWQDYEDAGEEWTVYTAYDKMQDVRRRSRTRARGRGPSYDGEPGHPWADSQHASVQLIASPDGLRRRTLQHHERHDECRRPAEDED